MDLNKCREDGTTPLMMAANNGHTLLMGNLNKASVSERLNMDDEQYYIQLLILRWISYP